MKRILFVFASMLFVASSALAAPKPTLNWGSQINSGVCSMEGDLVINAVMKITNDADSGVANNWWALDTFNKSVQVWTTDTPGVYCARVMYLGKFQAQAGQTAPGGSGILTGNEKGSVEGGYFATVTGTLNPDPGWQTNGMVGTFDLNCDLIGNCTGAGAANWAAVYFTPEANVDLLWWGWVYHGGRYGTWVNAQTGNSGNIGQ